MKNIKNISAIKKKVNSIKRTAISNNGVLVPWFSQLINSIHTFIVRIFFLDKIDPKFLAFLILGFKIFFKGGVYINIAIAVLVFFSHALDLEYKLTWELFTYLIPALYFGIKSYFTDYWGRLSSLIKDLLDKFSINLIEAKENVEKSVNKVKHVIDSKPDPENDSNKWKYLKYSLYAAGGLIILYFGISYWDDYTKPILSSPFVGVKKVYNFIKSYFGPTIGKGKSPDPKDFEPDYAGSSTSIDLESGQELRKRGWGMVSWFESKPKPNPSKERFTFTYGDDKNSIPKPAVPQPVARSSIQSKTKSL
jgi:hypothetical protein